MVAFDASEALTPYRAESGYGAILFDRERLRQAGADLFFQPNFSQPINFVGAVAIQAVAES